MSLQLEAILVCKYLCPESDSSTKCVNVRASHRRGAHIFAMPFLRGWFSGAENFSKSRTEMKIRLPLWFSQFVVEDNWASLLPGRFQHFTRAKKILWNI